MKKYRIALVGGTGFVGKHLAASLVTDGHEVVVCSRRPERNKSLSVLPGVQIKSVNFSEADTLNSALSGCDICINLLGILNESGHSGKGFRTVHVYYTKMLAAACQQLGIKRFLHMSAMNADQAKGQSHYLRSKGEGEDWLISQQNSNFHVTVFKPSVIFGPGDSFLNKFVCLLSMSVGFMPLPCPKSLMAPIFVGDVVNAMRQILMDRQSYGKRYELSGPTVYTLYDLVCYIAELTNSSVKVLPLNNLLSLLSAHILKYFPGKPFSYDNYLSAQQPSLSETSYFETFGADPRSVEAIVPTYIGKNTKSEAMMLLRQVR